MKPSFLSCFVISVRRTSPGSGTWLLFSTHVHHVAPEGDLTWQAGLTFAISRHAVVDLAQVMGVPPTPPSVDRLAANELARLEALLDGPGFEGRDMAQVTERLQQLRRMYEPYVNGFSKRLLMPLPPWASSRQVVDNGAPAPGTRPSVAVTLGVKTCR
jgi:hypothetical protein